MLQPLTVMLLTVAATLAAIPAAVGGDAHATQSDPGMIVVADPGNHLVQVFHTNGTFVFAFRLPIDIDGQFSWPNHVAVGPDGRIAVLDLYNHRIQVFHPNGTFAFTVGSYETATDSLSGLEMSPSAPTAALPWPTAKQPRPGIPPQRHVRVHLRVTWQR